VQACEGQATPAIRQQACSDLIEHADLSQPQLALTLYYRAMARLDQKSYGPALSDLDRSLGANPGLWPARWVHAKLLQNLRRNEEALKEWNAVLAVPQAQVLAAYIQRAVAEDHLGRFQEALADYDLAIRQGGTDKVLAEIYLDRATVFEALGQWTDSLADVNRVKALNSKEVYLYHAVGRIDFLRQDWSGAVAAFKQEIVDNPGNIYAMLWQALALGHLGRDVAQELRALSAGVSLEAWPGPIVKVLMGDIMPASIQWPSSTIDGGWSVEDQVRGEKCEFAFYWGEYQLLRGDTTKAKEQFLAAEASGIAEFLEYRAARNELARLTRD
jgi:tetratricopeptide (TPR) repeat protein